MQNQEVVHVDDQPDINYDNNIVPVNDYLTSKLQYVLYNRQDMTTSNKCIRQQSTIFSINVSHDDSRQQSAICASNVSRDDSRQQSTISDVHVSQDDYIK